MGVSSPHSGDPSFVIEALGPSHDRSQFQCGAEVLDRYFRQQVGQDVRRRVTACFVAREIVTGNIAGFYTLAAGGIPIAELPPQLAKRLPRYPTVPVARLGRLAIGTDYQRRGLGAALLWDALERAVRSEVAVHALVVDAKNEVAVRFYRHHGFVALTDRPRTLVLPLPKSP